MLKGLGGLGDMAKMMKMAQEAQAKVGEMQEELGRIVVVGEAGAGLVKARATAKGQITGLDLRGDLGLCLWRLRAGGFVHRDRLRGAVGGYS